MVLSVVMLTVVMLNVVMMNVVMLNVVAPVCEYQPSPIGLYHPLHGIINPKYKFLCFLTTNIFNEKKALAFNQDRCCHLVLCLQLILFHFESKVCR